MRRSVASALGIVGLLLGSGATASAQFGYFGGGTTIQGDYLRGMGAAAYGMGLYNVNTATADRINAGTFVFLNEYMYNCAVHQNRENARYRAEVRAKQRAAWETIQKRVLENPNGRDVTNGDALNALLTDLVGPQSRVTMAVIRTSPVPLSVDTIRKIPFQYAAGGADFSMQRLSIKGEKNWPVGLRGERIASERRAYERAMDDVLDHMTDKKLQHETILKLDETFLALRAKLDEVIPPGRDPVYMESKRFLDRLAKTREQVKLHNVEKIVAEIDNYAGTTVYDLLVFMDSWKLRFSVSDIGEERKLFNDLYVALVQQRDQVKEPDKGR